MSFLQNENCPNHPKKDFQALNHASAILSSLKPSLTATSLLSKLTSLGCEVSDCFPSNEFDASVVKSCSSVSLFAKSSGKIKRGILSPQLEGLAVVSHGSFFSCIKGTKSKTCPAPWLSDLRDPFSPLTLSHSSVKLGCTIRLLLLGSLSGGSLVAYSDSNVEVNKKEQKKKKVVVFGTGWAGISFLKDLDITSYDVQACTPTKNN